MIHVKEQANAKRMIAKHGVKLTTIGDDIYYLFDGKVWRTSADVIFRSEDDVESTLLQRMCRTV